MRGVVVLLAVSISACTAPSQQQGTEQTVELPEERKLEPDVVDLRGIWDNNSGLDLAKATARGLDARGIQVPVRVTQAVRGSYLIETIPSGRGNKVILDCILDLEGFTRDCHVVSGPEQLRTSAITTVISSWRWEPLHVDGVPKRAAVHLEVAAHLVEEEVIRN